MNKLHREKLSILEIRSNKRENGTPDGTYNIYNAGRFGDVYEMHVEDLEVLFCAIGKKLEEIKGGVGVEEGE